MVGLPCLVSQCAKLHLAGWMWAVFTRVYLESCTWPVAIFTMDQRKEQRVCIKFCANLGKSATETLTMIQQTFGDQSLSHAQMFQWHARYKTSVDGDEHTGRPTSCTNPENVAQIQELVHQDWCWTIRDIAEEVGIGYGTCKHVLMEELRVHCVAAKFIPRILTAGHKQQRVNVCTELNWTEKQNGCHPPPTILTWFVTLWLLTISKNGIEAERMPVWYHWANTGRFAERAWHSDRKGLPGSIPETEETVGPVSTCRRELLWGWRWLIGLMVNFTIFTA